MASINIVPDATGDDADYDDEDVDDDDGDDVDGDDVDGDDGNNVEEDRVSDGCGAIFKSSTNMNVIVHVLNRLEMARNADRNFLSVVNWPPTPHNPHPALLHPQPLWSLYWTS